MINDVRGYNYTGEPLAFLLEDSEKCGESHRTQCDGADLDRYRNFSPRYPFEELPGRMCELHCAFTDRMAEWNEGDFLLWVKTAKWSASPAPIVEDDDAAMVEMDIQTLTTMLMGYKRPTYLYQNERNTG